MFFPSNSFDGGKFWIKREHVFRDFMTLDDAIDFAGAIVLDPEKDRQKLDLFRQKGEVGLTLTELLS